MFSYYQVLVDKEHCHHRFIMVKVNASTLGHLTTSLKALDRILALKAEVSRLRHHVSVLSKRLNKFESAGRVLFTRGKTKVFPGRGEDELRSFWVGKAVEEEEGKEEVAEEERLVEEVAESEAEVAEIVATVEAEEEAEVVAVDLVSVAGGLVASGVSKALFGCAGPISFLHTTDRSPSISKWEN